MEFSIERNKCLALGSLPLRAHGLNGSHRGTDEYDTRIRAGTAKVSVFGQKTVARVNGLGPSMLSYIQNEVTLQVTVFRRGWANVICLISLQQTHSGHK